MSNGKLGKAPAQCLNRNFRMQPGCMPTGHSPWRVDQAMNGEALLDYLYSQLGLTLKLGDSVIYNYVQAYEVAEVQDIMDVRCGN
ncbi:MAG: hypothetical protein ACXWJK_15565 [Burkholderiaceae bacterium]